MAMALGKLGTPEDNQGSKSTIPALIQVLQDPDSQVRIHAALAH